MGHRQTISKNWLPGRCTSNKRLNRLFRRKKKTYFRKENAYKFRHMRAKIGLATFYNVIVQDQCRDRPK